MDTEFTIDDLTRMLIDEDELTLMREFNNEDFENIEAHFYDLWCFENDTVVNKLLMEKAARLRKKAVKRREEDAVIGQLGALQAQTQRMTATQMAAQQMSQMQMNQHQAAQMQQHAARQQAEILRQMHNMHPPMIYIPDDEKKSRPSTGQQGQSDAADALSSMLGSIFGK